MRKEKETEALTVNLEGTEQMILPTAQEPLVERGSGIDFEIVHARKVDTIGKLLANGGSLDIFLDDLGKAVYTAIGDFGIKTLPDEVTEKRIAHYIVRYFRDLTLEDVKLAFELAIAGELDINADHYNSFDLYFICKILNAYRKRLKKANQNLATKKAKPKELDISLEQKSQYRRDFNNTLCKHYKLFCETGRVGVMAFSFVFDLLVKEQIMDTNEKQIEKYRQSAIASFRSEVTNPANDVGRWYAKRVLKDFETAINTTEKNKIESLTKKIAVLDFFKTCKKKKIDFEKLMS